MKPLVTLGSGIGGLAWDGQALLVSEPNANLIHRVDPGSGQVGQFRRYTNHTYGIGFAPSGELFGCQQLSRRIIRFNPDGSTSPMPYRFADGGYHNMPRHLAVDAQGRIWFSDPVYHLPASGPPMPFPGHESVLRLDQQSDRSWLLRRATFDTTSPRGVAISPDQRTLYVADTGERHAELRAYPIQSDGTLGPFHVLHAFGADSRGRHPGAEGLCVQLDGTLVACAGGPDLGPGSLVYRLSPTGRVLSTIPLPDGMPTGCVVANDTLYIGTTAGHVYAVS